VFPHVLSRRGQWFRKSQIWRKRVGVEPTIRPAKGRIAGFEGRGSHRTPFASGGSIAGGENAIRLTAPYYCYVTIFIGIQYHLEALYLNLRPHRGSVEQTSYVWDRP